MRVFAWIASLVSWYAPVGTRTRDDMLGGHARYRYATGAFSPVPREDLIAGERFELSISRLWVWHFNQARLPCYCILHHFLMHVLAIVDNSQPSDKIDDEQECTKTYDPGDGKAPRDGASGMIGYRDAR